MKKFIVILSLAIPFMGFAQESEKNVLAVLVDCKKFPYTLENLEVVISRPSNMASYTIYNNGLEGIFVSIHGCLNATYTEVRLTNPMSVDSDFRSMAVLLGSKESVTFFSSTCDKEVSIHLSKKSNESENLNLYFP